MKRVICSLLLFVSPLIVMGQMVKNKECIPVNLALQNSINDLSNLYWPYIWDVPASAFEQEFCLLERKYVETGKTEYDAIYAKKWGDNYALRFYLGAGLPFMILGTEEHKPMFLKETVGYSAIYIEYNSESKYCNSYTLTFASDQITKRKSGSDFYYTKYIDRGRIVEFSDKGFTSSEIIGSNRQIKPDDPWEVAYNTNGDVSAVNNKNTYIELKWSYNEKTINYRKEHRKDQNSAPEYDIHRIRYSDMDAAGRWTKETLYDYDVVEDKMVPVYVIKRTFIPVAQLEKYKKADFNPSKVVEPEKPQEKEQKPNTSDAEETPQIDTYPTFNGGDANTFSYWVSKNKLYPASAEENGIQGKVYVKFTIETDGSVSNVTVVRSVDPDLDKEAVRVVSSSPQWTPAYYKGEPVRITYTVPVVFSLN